MILCATASAQQATNAQQVPGAVKDAGIYHVATGTWTRNVSGTANLGPDTIYKNDVGSGYFTTLNNAAATADWSIVDSGRVPATGSSIAGADRTKYTVNGFAFGYCSSIVGPNVAATFNLYDSYAPCDLLVTAPAAPVNLAGSFAATGLPGGTSAGALCWIVTLDLEGGGEFCLEGDGGPAFPGEDADVNTDSFGIEWIFNGAAGTSTGPLLNGDPTWTPSTAGALFWGGGGTFYNAATGCADTGLDTQDFFAIDGASPLNPGCYFFGGYKNTNGCGGPSNTPFGSFNSTVFAAAGECTDDPGTPFCDPAGVNDDGLMCTLTATADAGAGSGITLNATGGTAGQAGIMIVSDTIGGQVAISNGFLCLQGFGRYNGNSGADSQSLGLFNSSNVFEALGGNGDANGEGFRVPAATPAPYNGSIAGATWHFQLWYRDVPALSTFNFSNGTSVNF